MCYLILFVSMCTCICENVYQVCAGTIGGQQRASDPLALELWVVVSHWIRGLGTLRSFATEAPVLELPLNEDSSS